MTISKQDMLEFLDKEIIDCAESWYDEDELLMYKAVRAHLQSAVVVREGWKLVPCEPPKR